MKKKRMLIFLIILSCFFIFGCAGVYHYLTQTKLASVINTGIRAFKEAEIREVKLKAAVTDRNNEAAGSGSVRSSSIIDRNQAYCRLELTKDGNRTVQYYTAEGDHYYHLTSDTEQWYKEQGVGYSRKYNAALEEPKLYEDTEEIDFKRKYFHYRHVEKQKDGSVLLKIEANGSYYNQNTEVDFDDLWWIDKESGAITKCKSKETYKNAKTRQVVEGEYSFYTEEEVEAIDDLPEGFTNIPWKVHPLDKDASKRTESSVSSCMYGTARQGLFEK